MEVNIPECVNIWTDGCFDLFHYGHANFLREARAKGNRLVVGLHSNKEISENKGAPVTFINERMLVLGAVKWVDEIVVDAPYFTDVKFMHDYSCQICVHGDDKPVSKDGRDPYKIVKDEGRYQSCTRTFGISTTYIIEAVLNSNNLHSSRHLQVDKKYLLSMLASFQEGRNQPKKNDMVIYVSGCFQILHPNLIEYFRKLKLAGTFLLIGVYSDQTIRKYYNYYPILETIERSLAVLSLRHTDWVVVDAPYKIRRNFIREYNINRIYYGDCDFDRNDRTFKYSNVDENLMGYNIPPDEINPEFLWDRIKGNRLIYKNKINLNSKTRPK